jgi:MYXO-CTERM domain-containing protein
LLVGAIQDGEIGRLYLSKDGGQTFGLTGASLRPRALAERAGIIYAAGDNQADGFAIGVSEDGATWTPLARYNDVAATKVCPANPDTVLTCAPVCTFQVSRGVFLPQTCSGLPGPQPQLDAGPAGPDALPALPSGSGGCGCSVGGGGRPWAMGLLVLCTLVAARFRVRSSRARRHSRCRPPSRPAPPIAH